MIEVKTLPIVTLNPVQTDNEFPFFTREVYEEVNEDIEDAEITQHPIRPWITIKHKNVMIDGKRKITEVETWTNPHMGEPFTKPYTPEELLGLFWTKLAKPYLVPDSYELMKQGLIKQMRKPKHFKHNICQLNNNTISGKTINQRLIGMLNSKTRKQCTYTPGTSYCIHCGECRPHNYAVEHSSKEDKTGLTFAYPNIKGYQAFKTHESILFYYDSMRPYQGHDINRIRDNYSIKNPLSKSDNDITVIERVYNEDMTYHDYILHKGHDYSRIKAFDKEPEFIIHNGKRICRICGKKLRNNGRYCKSHTRSEINSFNRKISYITNLGHAKESYKESASATVHYGDLDGVDYIDNDFNPTPWNYTNYIKIQKDPNNTGKTRIKRVSGTRREYVNRTIKNKSKSCYVKLLRLMGFGSPSKHKYNTESNEKHIISVKPSRFCKHIIKNDKGIYRCDCLKHELLEANTCNTWSTVKVYGHHNDNIMEENRDIKRPEYSPSAYNYTGLNPTSIPTMREIPPKKLSSNIFINTSNNYKKTRKMIFDRYIITYNKLGHPVYYHLNTQETVPTNNITIPKAKRIAEQLLPYIG